MGLGGTVIRALKVKYIMSYQDYLKSNHWKELRKQYRESSLPKYCLVCKNPNFQLHHRSYVRLGKEELLDLIPLCGKCHWKVHEYFKTHPTKLHGTHKAIRITFKWTRKKTREIFRPFSFARRGFGWHRKEKKINITPKSKRISKSKRKLDKAIFIQQQETDFIRKKRNNS